MPRLRSAHQSYFDLLCKSMSTGKSLLLFTLACLAFGTGSRADAAPTSTTLMVTAGGSTVTAVEAQTVVTLTAKVTAGSLVTVGQVNFCDATAAYCTDIHLLGKAQLTSSGTAVLKLRPGAGIHSYKAVFLGTRSASASASSVSGLTVGPPQSGKYSSSTTLTPSMGQTGITLTAIVTGSVVREGSPSPSGTVSFLDTTDGNKELGSAELVPDPPGPAWTNPQTVALGQAGGILVADFNGDGIPDLAVPNYQNGIGRVSIFLGNGDGTFTASGNALSFATAHTWIPELGHEGAVGDFNGDGNLDMAITDFASNEVFILLGNGDGTFRQAASPSTGSYPQGIAAGDFNGDGVPDLAVTNAESNSVTILLGNGDGTFTAATESPATGPQPFDIAMGDFTGNGKMDLAVTNTLDHTVTILFGNGDGTFQAGTHFQVSPPDGDYLQPSGIAAVDLAGNGKTDLAVTTGNTVTILLGNGRGTFNPVVAKPATGGFSSGLAVTDFNGDGKPDLAVVNEETLTVLLGKGDGTFTPAGSSPDAGVFFNSIGIGDFNGDGVPDAATANWGSESVHAGGAMVLLTQMSPTATATASGISLPANSGTHEVVASYSGNGTYDTSVSSKTDIRMSPELSLSTTSVSFGEEAVGYSETQQVTATNTSNTTILNLATTMLGGEGGNFAAGGSCHGSLAPGATCTVFLVFTPFYTEQSIFYAEVSDNDPLFPQQFIALSGTGIIAPTASLSLSTTNLGFGSWGIGFPTPSQEVTVTNTSSKSILYLEPIMVGGVNASSFRAPNSCGNAGGSLAPGASCRISVIFNPVAAGTQSASIMLADNAANSPQTIHVSGTGIAAPAASLSLSTTNLGFGSWGIGFPTPSQEVFVTNTSSTAVLYFKSISVMGANASSFLAPNSCGYAGGRLAPGASCRISVIFNPVVLGPQSASIMLVDNAGNSPQTIHLSGTGIAAPAASLSLSTTNLGFGSWAIGSPTPSQEVFVTNTSSTSVLYFKSISVTGANASSFLAPNSCGYAGGSLAPGASCRISVIFNPVAAGTQSATIDLIDNASNSPQTINLTGTGLD
jgi:hypothetical protein